MRKVRVGFIGAGAFVSAHHLLTVRDSPVMEIAAIADLDEQKLRLHASRMQVGYTTTDYTKLLSDPAIDLIIIGTKQDLHARLIIESLHSGKWVFCEKPMAETDEDTQAVLAAEKAAKGRLAIGFNRRFAPAYVHAKQLMQNVPRPWFINYRLMFPNPEKQHRDSFYAAQPRILYEGCHILDLMLWFLGAAPSRVFMSGDPLMNNCCILDFPDGSQVGLMCGSMGSYSLWKEYMEVFGTYVAITVSDFVDMRVRGFEDRYDQLFAPDGGEYADQVMRFGFDFYETCKGAEAYQHRQYWSDEHGMTIEAARRPTPLPADALRAIDHHGDSRCLNPDKGWRQSLEHFAECFSTGSLPRNADAASGAASTTLALALLKSLQTGQAVPC